VGGRRHKTTARNKPNRSNARVRRAGESHAGHYILSFADHVLQVQRDAPAAAPAGADASAATRLHVKSLAIGNGWIDPYHQVVSRLVVG
jgi:carboxypeptidase C (cathepsin A)